MNLPNRTSGLTKLLAFSLLATAANVPTAGVSAAEQQPVKATCSAPDHTASVAWAHTPDMPAIAKIAGWTGSTVVRVSLAPSGALMTATVAHSSGYSALDNEALLSVRQSKYEPETVSCQPVAGDYLVNIAFE